MTNLFHAYITLNMGGKSTRNLSYVFLLLKTTLGSNTWSQKAISKVFLVNNLMYFVATDSNFGIILTVHLTVKLVNQS